MSLWQDIRFSLRSLRRQPGFSLTSLAILTLGIGANATIFTAVKTILLDPLPYQDPSQLVGLHEWGVLGNGPGMLSPPDFYDWQHNSKSFIGMAAYGQSGGTLSGDTGRLPENVKGTLCTWNLFDVLGVQPALGRAFASSNDTPVAPHTILLSNSLWRSRFNADPHILGKSLRLDSELYTVIGVMPSSFEFWYPASQYWVPIQGEISPRQLSMRGSHRLFAVGRLKPGVSIQKANAELSGIQARIKQQHPGELLGSRAYVQGLWSDLVGKPVRTSLYLLWAAVACILLIACVNVANLLLTRNTGRSREVAIRMALGASRRRIVWLFTVESLLISCAGGASGVLLAAWLTGLLVKISGVLPRASAITLDWTTVLFAAFLAMLSGVAAGLLPALAASDIDLNRAVHETSRNSTGSLRRQGHRNALVAGEIALSFLLLAGAGLLLKSFVQLRTVNVGFNPEHLLTMKLTLPSTRYRSDTNRAVFYERLSDGLKMLPGVRGAGLVSVLPIAGHFMDTDFTIAGRLPLPPGHFNDALVRTAGPDYFRAMGIPLLRGRFFTSSERLAQADRAIISESFARQYFPNQNPIGQHMTFFSEQPKEIVGVVGDVRIDPGSAPEPTMYAPVFSGVLPFMGIALRTDSDPLALALPVQQLIAKLDPDLAVSDVLTMNQLIGSQTANQQWSATLLSVFAGLALLLTAVGLYGVISYATAQRTSEFGIRLALGATPGDLLRSVLAQGLRPALGGLAGGLIGSYFLAHLLTSMLFHVKPFDPAIFVAVTFLLLTVSAFASLMPALRTTKIDPAQALRTE